MIPLRPRAGNRVMIHPTSMDLDRATTILLTMIRDAGCPIGWTRHLALDTGELGSLASARCPNNERRRSAMTLCPIALAVTCKKCPAFSVCPVKGVIGDYRKQEETQTKPQADNEKEEVQPD